MTAYEKKKLSRNLSEKFFVFVTTHSPTGFSRRLRDLLMDYMIHQQQTGFPVDFTICLSELSDLFDLLDTAGDELERKREVKPQ